MTRVRITWNDGTTQTINRTEASIDVKDSGLIVAKFGDRVIYIPPTSYKQLAVES